MNKIIDLIAGDIKEKKRYRQYEKRAKNLPKEYTDAYNDIKNYLWNTGMMTVDPLYPLVELFEEASANGKHVVDIIGSDVAAFADDLVRGEKTYSDLQRKKLNDSFKKK